MQRLGCVEDKKVKYIIKKVHLSSDCFHFENVQSRARIFVARNTNKLHVISPQRYEYEQKYKYCSMCRLKRW